MPLEPLGTARPYFLLDHFLVRLTFLAVVQDGEVLVGLLE